MRRIELLLDVDEVLVDFQTPTFEIIEQLTGVRYTPFDFQVWDIFEAFDKETQAAIWKQIERPGWCYSLRPFPEAQAALEEMRSWTDVEIDIYALTSPHHGVTWYYERVESLKKNFDIDKKHVHQTSAKFMVGGDAFVEDNPDHCVAWRKRNPKGLAMLRDIPNTRMLGHDDIRVRNWKEIVERVGALRDAAP